MPKKPDPATEDLAYAPAMAELESILTELERVDLDVDQLATNVERAALLIRTCRGRVSNARMQVEQLSAELDP